MAPAPQRLDNNTPSAAAAIARALFVAEFFDAVGVAYLELLIKYAF